ncbi:MAG: hypothetical protein KatS3mg076_3227 [Candidatus Binatia bacterium]|nr:MAG: hypothetical protein KatS3mg076_3227 [Candidatus Binatia bacterium]
MRSRKKGRRPAAVAARTRERILATAERLFARKGYAATSLREIAEASGVRMFTIHHHFGSKLRLYEEIVRRWDAEVGEIVERVAREARGPRELVERIVDVLFDFFLRNRGRVALHARKTLGEGLPRRVSLHEGSWLGFVEKTRHSHRLGDSGLDPRLLLLTVEGILHNHALSRVSYQRLFGRDVTDRRLAARTRRHLREVILRLVEPRGGRGAGASRPERGGRKG